jgi:hypothetical protein
VLADAVDKIRGYLSDPANRDANLYYEDKFALIWNINNSIRGFSLMGCIAGCHVGDPGKPYGKRRHSAQVRHAFHGGALKLRFAK